MLQNNNIKNISELNSTFCDTNKKTVFFLKFIDILKIGKFHAIFPSAKEKEISAILLIRMLLRAWHKITFTIFVWLCNSILYSLWNSFLMIFPKNFTTLSGTSKWTCFEQYPHWYPKLHTRNLDILRSHNLK